MTFSENILNSCPHKNSKKGAAAQCIKTCFKNVWKKERSFVINKENYM